MNNCVPEDFQPNIDDLNLIMLCFLFIPRFRNQIHVTGGNFNANN